MQPGQHRETARVILVDQDERILLLHTHFDPEVGLPPRWITPGGGIDPGESIPVAASRELQEETGMDVPAEKLGDLVWQTEGRWDWGDGINHHTFVDYFFELRTEHFDIDRSGWTEDEIRDVLEIKWWNIDDLIASGEIVGPPGLAEFLKHLLV